MSCEGSLSHFKQILKRVTLHKQEGITTRFLLLVARRHQVVSAARLLGYKLLPVPSQTITYAYFLFQIFPKPKVLT